MSTVQKDLLMGTRYRSLGTLGKGGMGTVVEAEMVELGKRVAVKILHPDMSKHPGLVDRLRVEAETLARLSSPHLVPVHDIGKTASGQPFFVMERLQGRSLRQELSKRGPLPVLEAITYARHALLGLQAAHDVGVIHRDIKLDNLFLCDAVGDGARVVKVLDFGVAKVLGQKGGPAAPALVTEEGVTVGTPRYLSPEQCRGRQVDARSDVYSVGLVLYTLIAGRDPFAHAEGFLALLQAHATEIPEPPSRFAPRPIPAEVEQAVLRALAKDPDERFPSARAFADELEAIAGRVRVSAFASTEPISARLLGGPPVQESTTIPRLPREAQRPQDPERKAPATARAFTNAGSWRDFGVAMALSATVLTGILLLVLRLAGIWR